ncbi:MAG: phosphatase PAP2 family protein [Rhodanobacter sp.]
MEPTLEWIATHALLCAVIALLLAILIGDLAWRYNAYWQRGAVRDGRAPNTLRWPVGLGLGVILAALFATLATAISAAIPGPLVRVDTGLASLLSVDLSIPTLRGVAVLTHLGGPLWVGSVAIIISFLLLRSRHMRLAAMWATALLGIVPIKSGFKLLFQRVRPPHDHNIVIENGWSFPSGHALGAIVFYGMLAYVLLKLLPPRFHRIVIAAAISLVGAIGISRILLQVHYLSDVLAGYACGGIWLMLCIGMAEYLGNVPTATRPKAEAPGRHSHPH